MTWSRSRWTDDAVDSSVLLRVILGEQDRLPTWPRISNAIASELIRLECLRTIDRARVRLRLDDRQVSGHRADVLEACDSFTLGPLDRVVLGRAAEPFPTLIGSSDAIHLASAILARERYPAMVMATHDRELAIAAAEGLEIHGAG